MGPGGASTGFYSPAGERGGMTASSLGGPKDEAQAEEMTVRGEISRTGRARMNIVEVEGTLTYLQQDRLHEE